MAGKAVNKENCRVNRQGQLLSSPLPSQSWLTPLLACEVLSLPTLQFPTAVCCAQPATEDWSVVPTPCH